MGNCSRMFFKSITVDNGSEFADCEGMETSVLKSGRSARKCTTPTHIQPAKRKQRKAKPDDPAEVPQRGQTLIKVSPKEVKWWRTG